LSYSKVTAPISGRVGLRPVDVGNYVSTGDTTGVATITQVAPIDVMFALPADTVTAIQERTSTGTTLPTVALDRTRTKLLAQGTFLTLDNQIDTQTGTIKAKARFTNDKASLFPNQFVNVQVELDTVGNAIVVPANAIRHGPKGEFVYVVGQDKTAHVRMIKTGPATDELTSVTAGLNVGERVVTEGGDRLTDGSAVRLPGEGGGARGRNGQRAAQAQSSNAQQTVGEHGASGSGTRGRAGQHAAQASGASAGGQGGTAAGADTGSGAQRVVGADQASGAQQPGTHKRRQGQQPEPADAG
jgi:multidrug efflux system membrane fusion protein